MADLIPANMKMPAHIAARMKKPSALASSLTGGLAAGTGGPRISIKGGRFRIVDGDAETLIEQTYLNVIIVGANPRLSKTFYEGTYDPKNEPAGPTCFSLDGIKPDASAEDPQNDLCATCPQNAWGSKISANGNEIKACADKKRLAIVAADDPEGPVYLLEVTPAALKGLNQYSKELSARGIPAEVVVTKVSFDPDASFPKLMFKFAKFIDEDAQATVDELLGSDKVMEITGEKISPVVTEEDVEPPAPKRKPAVKAKPAPEPEPEEDDEDDEEEAEEPPKPARGFGATKVKAKAKPVVEDDVEAPAPKRKAKPKAKPKAEPAAASSLDALADEIGAMLGEDMDD